MNASVAISGSFAYDTIMVFEDRFKNHILPEQVHILNVSFLVPQLRREFGGCAGNIAYTLKLLGGAPLPVGAVGADFAPYRDWLKQNEIESRHILETPDAMTAQAFVTTDIDNNQITAFHPGAMNDAHRADIPTDADFGIVAPNGREAMLAHAAQFDAAGIDFVFDPGQGLPMFDCAELLRFIERAKYVAVNDYEYELLRQKTELDADELARRVDALIVTRGARGADIYHNGECLHIDCAPIARAVDPTGCGDAFRAGLLYGITRQLDWRTCARIATLLGAIKIEQHGTQNHRFTQDEFESRYRKSFGESIRLA